MIFGPKLHLFCCLFIGRETVDNELDRSTTVERRPSNSQVLNIPITSEKENNVCTISSLIDAPAIKNYYSLYLIIIGYCFRYFSAKCQLLINVHLPNKNLKRFISIIRYS